jgi:hypothetical protein
MNLAENTKEIARVKILIKDLDAQLHLNRRLLEYLEKVKKDILKEMEA